MGKYIQKRLVGMIVLLFLVSVAAFTLMRLVPGGAAFTYLNSINAPVTSAALVKARTELGLDRPVIFQCTVWLRRVVCLDLGVSFMTKKPVSGQLPISFRYTAILATMSVVWIAMLFLLSGIMTGKRPGNAGDQLIRGVTFLGDSVPSSWLGFPLVELFALKLKLLPVRGAKTFSHLVLLSVTFAYSYIIMYTEMIRGGIVENIGRQYAVYDRARDLKENTVSWRHVLPDALNPIFTTLGLDLGSMLSRTVTVENMLTWPGVGRLVVSAVTGRDYPTIQGYILAIAVVYTSFNLGMDMLYVAMSPQIRFRGEER